jgi:methyl-accepting chemotaxis protein
MNLSSLFKNNQAITLLLALLGVMIYALISSQFILGGIVLVLILIAFVVPSEATPSHASNLSSSIQRVVANAAQGKLEDRVTGIPKTESAETKLAWDVNNLLDQLESLIRDMTTSIDKASQGITYRTTYSAGLQGVFQSTSENMRKPIEGIISGRETQMRGKMSEDFGNLGGGLAEGLTIIQGDIIASQGDATEIVSVSNQTAEQSSKSLKSVIDIGQRLSNLVELISSSHQGIINLESRSREISEVVGLIKDC